MTPPASALQVVCGQTAGVGSEYTKDGTPARRSAWYSAESELRTRVKSHVLELDGSHEMQPGMSKGACGVSRSTTTRSACRRRRATADATPVPHRRAAAGGD